MLRHGQRLCRTVREVWSCRCRVFSSSVNSDQSLSHQLADEGGVKREADDETQGKISTRSWTAVARPTKPLTREPFAKNLFLGKFDTVSCFAPAVNYFSA